MSSRCANWYNKYWLFFVAFNTTGTRTIVKKRFSRDRPRPKEQRAFGSFLWVFSFIPGNFIDLKIQPTTSSIHRILTLLKYFTYVNFYWCWNICLFHFISFHFIDIDCIRRTSFEFYFVVANPNYIKCFLKYLADFLSHMTITIQSGKFENNLGCLI